MIIELLVYKMLIYTDAMFLLLFYNIKVLNMYARAIYEVDNSKCNIVGRRYHKNKLKYKGVN